MKNLQSIFYLLLFFSCSEPKQAVNNPTETKIKETRTVVSIMGTDTLEKITGYNADGGLSYEGYLLNNEPDSVYLNWYSDTAQLREQIAYSHGQRNGKTEEWYRNGHKKYEVNYSLNIKNGTEIQWYENGVKKLEGSWNDDMMVEVWTYWYENGMKKEEGAYQGGDYQNIATSTGSEPNIIPYKHGKWTYWDDTGKLIKTEEWYMGNRKDK